MKTLMKQLCSCVTIAAMALAASGCGGGNDGAPVSGSVTLDGQPLEKGTVAFIGENGTAASIGIIENGSYQLRQTANASGIAPGTYKVTIESWEVAPGALQEDGTFAQGKSAIPEKYNKADTSGFTADVTEGGGTFDFALKSDADASAGS